MTRVGRGRHAPPPAGRAPVGDDAAHLRHRHVRLGRLVRVKVREEGERKVRGGREDAGELVRAVSAPVDRADSARVIFPPAPTEVVLARIALMMMRMRMRILMMRRRGRWVPRWPGPGPEPRPVI